MRLPLADGLPFTGSKTVLDLNGLADAQTARFVTLYAVNFEPAEGTVQASLVIDEDTIALPETRLAATLLKPRWVLERFPMMGAASLTVEAAPGVFCFGFVELEPSEVGSRPEMFAPTAPAAPFASPDVTLRGEDEHVVHVVPDGGMQELSFVLDAQTGTHFELRFYRDDELVVALPFQGPLLTLEFFDHIPVQGPVSVRVQIVEVANSNDGPSIYGSMVRR